MSCQLTLLANFERIHDIRKYLFPREKEENEADESEGWDADWDWKNEDEEEKEEGFQSWMQECHVSLSPAGNMIAMASQDRLALLAQKWDSVDEDVPVKYEIVYKDILKQENGEKITSVVCLPLASQKRSSQGGPDWTCVMVGFSSGYVRIYTENGTLLLSQIFSEEPVQKIKCRTYEPARHAADAEKHEELSILYRKALVTIDGFSFYQSIRACRNQVARAVASGSDLNPPPPLAYKKWAFHDQDQITDHITCGLVTPNPFDQMQTGSMLGGYQATIRPTPPASHLYATAGKGPYVGFYTAVEGSVQPMLSDVAHAVASKLKSALFSQISAASGWFGFGGQHPQENDREKKRPKIEPATSLSCRFGLHDKRRDGESIVLSPDNRMAATTDSFSRVMLIDVIRGLALRIWKGYRDAQVGWVEAREDLHHDPDQDRYARPSEPRHAMFLIIYAPRRGILEVWTAQGGPRVAAFNVSKWCRLLCPGYGMLGLNNATYHGVKVQKHGVYLIDPEGTLRTVEVPFHLSLSDRNSKRARDMHLLKKLKLTLRETSTETSALESEVISTLHEIKIFGIRQQGLERVLQTKYLSDVFLANVLKEIRKQLETQRSHDDSDGLDYEGRVLLQYCKAKEHLIHTYSSIQALNTEEETAMEIENNIDYLAKAMDLSSEEMTQLSQDLERYSQVGNDSRHVHFDGDNSIKIVNFLSCFQFHSHREHNAGTEGSDISVKIHSGLSNDKKVRLANFLFKHTMSRGTTTDYNILLKHSHIVPEHLLNLLLYLCLTDDRLRLETVPAFSSLIKSISSLKGYSELIVGHNALSPWWQSMRDALSQSEHICSALLGANVGRNVAMEIAKIAVGESQLNSSTDSNKVDLSDWESVTLDRAQWSLLVKQLEDLLALQCLLQMKPAAHTFVTKESEPISVSVSRVLEGGTGVLPELVAKWIAGHGVLPSMLCLQQEESLSEKDEPMEIDKTTKESSHSTSSDGISPFLAQLQDLQRRLPLSLEADILMANCAWEYIVLWNKDAEVIFPLEQALSYLRCIQNAVLQHGVAVLMWQTFIIKKLSNTALLMEKVGKSPKDRLLRRDIGLSEGSVEKFLGLSTDLLETILQAGEDSHEVPMFSVEDLWQNVQGPTSLVKLATEQRATNKQLVQHHYCLCVILHAIVTFTVKNVKPLSLYDLTGRNAFFKPLHSTPSMPDDQYDESLFNTRRQFFCRVINHAVQALRDQQDNLSASSDLSNSPPLSLIRQRSSHSKWPQLMQRVATDLSLDPDDLKRHYVCELYSNGLDKIAEEVLLTVSDHETIGSQLCHLVGQRLHHFFFITDPPESVEKLSKCSPTVSNWLKTFDSSELRQSDVPLSDTAALLAEIISHLPEGHSEYNLAIELVDLVQAFL